MTSEPLQATISLRGVVLNAAADVVVLRSADDGDWELPGGRLGAHEDALPGLRREIVEETDLSVVVDEPIHTVSWRNDSDRGRFGVYYRCQTDDREISLSAEHTDYAWITPDAAIDRLGGPQARAVERAVAEGARDAGAIGPGEEEAIGGRGRRER